MHDNNQLILKNKINNALQCYLLIQHTSVEALIIDGNNYIGLLDKLIHNHTIVEVAFGVNKSLQQSIQPHINSPMNEGVWGFHLGIGTGKNECHIDFISTKINFNHFHMDVA